MVLVLEQSRIDVVDEVASRSASGSSASAIRCRSTQNILRALGGPGYALVPMLEKANSAFTRNAARGDVEARSAARTAAVK